MQLRLPPANLRCPSGAWPDLRRKSESSERLVHCFGRFVLCSSPPYSVPVGLYIAQIAPYNAHPPSFSAQILPCSVQIALFGIQVVPAVGFAQSLLRPVKRRQ